MIIYTLIVVTSTFYFGTRNEDTWIVLFSCSQRENFSKEVLKVRKIILDGGSACKNIYDRLIGIHLFLVSTTINVFLLQG